VELGLVVQPDRRLAATGYGRSVSAVNVTGSEIRWAAATSARIVSTMAASQV